MTRYLTIDDAAQVLDRLGFHVRDAGLVSSALARPGATMAGADAYPALELKAAALLESVVRNHALLDGNKRTGWALTSLFFWINGYRLEAKADEAFDLVVDVAGGGVTPEESARALKQWCTRRDSNPRSRT